MKNIKINFDEREVIELYKQGLSIKKISLKYGFTNSSRRLWKFIKNKEIAKPKITSGKLINFDKNKAIKLYQMGKTILEVSELMGFSGTSKRINNLIKEKGLSRKSRIYLGKKNPNWKGGKQKTKKGYIRIGLGKRDKRQFEHRLIWRGYHSGVPIPKGWIIHHRDMNPSNNYINNLILLPRAMHKEIHRKFNLGEL